MGGSLRFGRLAAMVVVAVMVAGSPVVASAQGGGGGTPTPGPITPPAQTVSGTYANRLINPTLALSDLNLRAQTPFVPPAEAVVLPGAPRPAGPSYIGSVVGPPNYLPYLNQPCSLTYNATVSLGPVQGSSRRVTWLTPDQWIGDKYDATKQIGGWLAYDPSAGQLWIDPHPDGYFVVDAAPMESSIVPAHETVQYAGQLLGGNDVTVPYKLTGVWKLIASTQGAICDVTKWEFAGLDDVGTQALGLQCQSIVLCGVPIVNVIPPTTNPPCSTRVCVPAVESVISGPDLLAKVRRVWQDGGTVIHAADSPDLAWEAVGLTAKMKLSGPPVDTPDQYLSVCSPVGRVRVTAACFEVHLRMGGATWKLSNDETGATQDICTATISCDYKFDRVGHYHMRAVEDVGVEYRYMMYTSSSSWVYQDWAPYPGLANFQLCARPAMVNPPDCAPGQPIVVGQFEAVPAVTGTSTAPSPSPSPSPQ